MLLEKGERPERDKLDRRRSTELTIPASSDARLMWFITVIVKLCLQHDSVAQVGQLATADTQEVTCIISSFSGRSYNKHII